MRSVSPDYFLGHFNNSAILHQPTAFKPQRGAQLKPTHVVCKHFCTMNKVIISQIEGWVGGSGSELLNSSEIRFNVRGKKVNQKELLPVIITGGIGSQWTPRLMRYSRALELVLNGGHLDIETTESREYPNLTIESDAIGPFVNTLAWLIVSFPPPAVRQAKLAIIQSVPGPRV